MRELFFDKTGQGKTSDNMGSRSPQLYHDLGHKGQDLNLT